MTDFRAPVTVPAPAFYLCNCGHGVSDHGRRVVDGHQEYVGCRIEGCGCSLFHAIDGSGWPYWPRRPDPEKAAA